MKQENGITLIALVVTIIVLLILAGITLSLVSGENGILKRATNSVEENDKATAQEELELAITEIKIKYYEEYDKSSGKTLGDYIIENLNGYKTPNGTISTENGKVIYTGSNGTITGTIGENGGLEVDKKAIILNPTKINLKVEEGLPMPTANITADLIGITGEITWTTANANIATIEGNGTTVTIKAISIGKTTVTAKCGEYTVTCEVKIEQEITQEQVMGKFVRYNVEYTDIYDTERNYTAENGWRILSLKKSQAEEGKYDIEIISTGVPAGLYYWHNNIVNLENNGATGNWAGNEEQRREYEEKFYVTETYNDRNIYAAAGLYRNFEKIIFNASNASTVKGNYGYFTKINNQEPSDTTTGSIFRSKESKIAGKIKAVRSIMLSDITGSTEKQPNFDGVKNEKVSGLFVLDHLGTTENAQLHGVSDYTTAPSYYLNSPSWYTNNMLMYVLHDGMASAFANKSGVRPVISIEKVQMNWDSEKDRWEIE